MVVGPSPLHSLLSSGYGDRVQAQSTSTGACDLQSASRHGSIRSWQRGRQAGEGEEGEEGEGPAPLLKSRDPLLAGGEKNMQSPAHKTAARTHTKSNYIRPPQGHRNGSRAPHGRSNGFFYRLPFAKPQTLQTFQLLQKFAHLRKEKAPHGRSNGFFYRRSRLPTAQA